MRSSASFMWRRVWVFPCAVMVSFGLATAQDEAAAPAPADPAPALDAAITPAPAADAPAPDAMPPAAVAEPVAPAPVEPAPAAPAPAADAPASDAMPPAAVAEPVVPAPAETPSQTPAPAADVPAPEPLPPADPAPVVAEPIPAAPAADGAAVVPVAGEGAAPAEAAKTEDKPVEEEPVVFAPEPLAAPRTAGSSEPLFAPDTGRSSAPSVDTDMSAFNYDLKPEDMAALQKQVRLQAQEVEGLQAYDKANQAKVLGNYEEALRFYGQAFELIPKRPQTVDLRQGIRAEQADCQYRIAEARYAEGKWTDADAAARSTLSYDSTHRKAMELIEKCRRRKIIEEEASARPVPPRREPEFLKKEDRIQGSMKLGRQYMSIGEYEKAKTEFKKVIMEDPENTAARAYLREISEDEYDIYSKAAKATAAERMAEVKESWSAPASRDRIGRSALPKADQPDQRFARSTRLAEKLNQIKIKEINFREASIVDVVEFLVKASREGDVTSAPNERGINIILNPRRPGDAAPAAAPPPPPPTGEAAFFADPTATPAASDAAGAVPAALPPPDAGVPRITLNLQNVVLLDAIRYITELTGLKYRLEESAVIITPADVVYGQVVTRVYTVQPSLIEMTREEAPTTGGGAEGFDFGGTAQTTGVRHDVKKFFVDAGVPFPEGTSIIYKPAMNKLLVSNTPDNLERFERILAELNVVPTQVEIESRFVEIGQDDLEEIGMEWLLTDNWELAENASAGAPLMPGGRERIQVNRTDFTRGLRFLNTQGSPASQTGGRATMGGLLSVSSILTNPEVSFILHALEQRSGANLLSAPKVTTKSGQNAEIKVIRELRYPTDWEQNAQAAATGGGTAASQTTRVIVSPTDFETRDVGVILNVTPMVGPDGYTIDLTMLPQVVEITEWIDYGQDQFDDAGRLVGHLAMYQPVFHVRTIATSISIWDGETVVMGGLITESQSTTDDKVPLLGDIPLLGYLFRNKTTKSQKRNLLIFVTARLVDPSGRIVRKPEDQAAATTTTTP